MWGEEHDESAPKHVVVERKQRRRTSSREHVDEEIGSGSVEAVHVFLPLRNGRVSIKSYVLVALAVEPVLDHVDFVKKRRAARS